MAVVALNNGKKKQEYQEGGKTVDIGSNIHVTKPGGTSYAKSAAGTTQTVDDYLDLLAEHGLTDTDYSRGSENGYSPYGGASGRPSYTSPYSSQIDSLLNSVLNREDFSYDVESDPLYQQYRAQYQREGDRAMRDTMGNAAALTGGYGSSYAATAGSQAYDYYLSQLNDRVPELQQIAYQQYLDEQNALLSQLAALQAMEDQAYSRYRDEVGDYYSDRAFDYQAAQDALAQQNWQAQFDYGKSQDELAQQNWLAQFDYGKSQDALAQQNWLAEFNYQKQQDAISNSLARAKAGSSGKVQHSEMYELVRKQAEEMKKEGKTEDEDIARHVLDQDITSEEAESILRYLGLLDAIPEPWSGTVVTPEEAKRRKRLANPSNVDLIK